MARSAAARGSAILLPVARAQDFSVGASATKHLAAFVRRSGSSRRGLNQPPAYRGRGIGGPGEGGRGRVTPPPPAPRGSRTAALARLEGRPSFSVRVRWAAIGVEANWPPRARRGPAGIIAGVTAPYRVLFVCAGNIIRSPLAENLFRQLADQAGLDGQFDADSAGTGGWHAGESPDARMRRTAAAPRARLRRQRPTGAPERLRSIRSDRGDGLRQPQRLDHGRSIP